MKKWIKTSLQGAINPSTYPDVNPERFEDIYEIDWNNLLIADIAEIAEDSINWPDSVLHEIAEVSYFNEEQEEWANEHGFDGGYVVEYTNGSKKYFAWNHGYGPIVKVNL